MNNWKLIRNAIELANQQGNKTRRRSASKTQVLIFHNSTHNNSKSSIDRLELPILTLKMAQNTEDDAKNSNIGGDFPLADDGM